MNRTFPETLSALRREKNRSQRQVAMDLGISQALLSHYENGSREPGLGFVRRVCDYYDVSADYILCRSDNMRPCEVAQAKGYLRHLRKMIDRADTELDLICGDEA